MRRWRARAQASEVDPWGYFVPSKHTRARRLAGSADGTAHSSTAGKAIERGADVIGRTICRRYGARGTSLRRLREVTPRAGGVRRGSSPATGPHFIEHKL